MIRLWYRNGDFKNNTVFFKDITAKYPSCREAHSFLALEYLSQGQYHRAQKSFRSALTKDGKTYSYVDYFNTQANYGILLLRTGRFQAASDLFSKLLKANNRRYSECLFNLAVCCLKLGKCSQAKRLLIDYLKIKPNNPDGLFLLGKASFMLGENKEAYSAFRKYLRVEPNAVDRDFVEKILQGESSPHD